MPPVKKRALSCCLIVAALLCAVTACGDGSGSDPFADASQPSVPTDLPSLALPSIPTDLPSPPTDPATMPADSPSAPTDLPSAPTDEPSAPVDQPGDLPADWPPKDTGPGSPGQLLSLACSINASQIKLSESEFYAHGGELSYHAYSAVGETQLFVPISLRSGQGFDSTMYDAGNLGEAALHRHWAQVQKAEIQISKWCAGVPVKPVTPESLITDRCAIAERISKTIPKVKDFDQEKGDDIEAQVPGFLLTGVAASSPKYAAFEDAADRWMSGVSLEEKWYDEGRRKLLPLCQKY